MKFKTLLLIEFMHLKILFSVQKIRSLFLTGADFRHLTTFYYMCTKWFADGDVHAYFNPYETPYDAYISFMNALHDLELRVRASLI